MQKHMAIGLAGLIMLLAIGGCSGQTKRIDVDAEPAGLAMDPRGMYLFIGCQGGQTVIAWDIKKNKKVSTLSVGGGEQRLYFDRISQELVLINKEQKKVSRLTWPQLSVRSAVQLPGIPAAWYEDETRKTNYYALPDKNEIVSYIKGNAMPVIQIGLGPEDVAKQPDADYLWAANYKANEVAVVNLDSNLVVKRIHVWANPYRLAMAPFDEKMYVLCIGRDAAPSKSVIQTIDLNYQTAGLTWSLGKEARDMQLDPKGRFLFVIEAEGLKILSIDTGIILEKIKTPSPPSAMTVSPDGSTVYLAGKEEHAVYRYKINRKQLLER